MYVQKTTKISDDISLIHKHGPGRYGAPGQKRKKREKESPEAVKENNRKERARKIQLMILCNFQKGHHLVLGYPKGEAPETYEQAEKILLRFLDDIRRECKRKGYAFRYIAATERGKRTAVLHHHVLIQDINEQDLNLLKLIEERWTGKRVHATAIYEDDTCGKQLADYITKSIDKEGEPKGKYHISRNMKKPEVKRELIFGRMDEPEAPAGFQIVEDTLCIGTNPYTGWMYQRYFIRANETGRNSEWKRAFSENEDRETLPGAVRRIFIKVTDVLFQNGNADYGTVEKQKTRNGKHGKHLEEKPKPDVQNGNAASRLVDKIKTALGAGKRHTRTGTKPAEQNGNGGLSGQHTHSDKHPEEQQSKAGG